jgi:hypothetical protein
MENQDNGENGVKVPTKEEIEAQVQALVAEQVKDIKAKLDNAYNARDEAVRKAAQLEEQRRTAEMEALTAAGKHTEAAQLKLAALEEKNAHLLKQLTGYQRDAVLENALRGVEFRSERSANLARQDIIDALVQNEQGEWVHKTGVAIKDYVSAFQKDPENEFLFKPKQNGGAGAGAGAGVPGKSTKKITEMSTTELLAAAAAGQFGQQSF